MISTINRKRIYIFVAIAFSITIVLALVAFFTGGIYLSSPGGLNPLYQFFVFWSMLAPAIANILTRLITREGSPNLFLRPNLRRGWSLYLAALFLPVVAILAGGAIYYLLFPSRFDPSMIYAHEVLGMVARGDALDPLTFIVTQAAFAIAMSLLDLPWTFGEEFGWRAYLQQKLMPLGPRKAVLLVGVVWGIWHWPGIFLGRNYGFGYWGDPVVGPLLFVWSILPASTVYGWLTLRSGSVWPAAVAHGVNNACAVLMVWFIRGPINQLLDPLIGPTEVGIIGSLGWFILALPIFLIPGALAPATVPQVGYSAPAEVNLGKTAG